MSKTLSATGGLPRSVPSFERWIKVATPRQLRLFAVAAARNTPGLALPPESLRAVEDAELTADGLAAPDVWMRHNPRMMEEHRYYDQDIIALACSGVEWIRDYVGEWLANTPDCPTAAILSCLAGPCARVCGSMGCLGGGYVPTDRDDNTCDVCHGSGYVAAPLPTVPASVLAWNNGCLMSMATRIYSGYWESMPILRDALLDAGCTVELILNHCLEPLHAKGCFVVDALLGKC